MCEDLGKSILSGQIFPEKNDLVHQREVRMSLFIRLALLPGSARIVILSRHRSTTEEGRAWGGGISLGLGNFLEDHG